MKTSIAYIVVAGTINAYVGGKQYSIASDSPYFEGAKAALKNKDAKGFVANADLDKTARERSRGQITFAHGVIRWNGQPVHNALTKRILALVKQDFDFQPLLNFLEKLMRNPDSDSINELYLFLEANTLPITEAGNFLAYRRVDKNYLSLHANPDGTRNSNKIGESVTMKRSECERNRDKTCSKGLHFASLSYIPHYGSDSNGDRTVVVEIDPSDVVSIPSDYNNQKGRCCKYTVVSEHLDGENNDTLSNTAVYKVTPTGITPAAKFSGRDPATGRFCRQ